MGCKHASLVLKVRPYRHGQRRCAPLGRRTGRTARTVGAAFKAGAPVSSFSLTSCSLHLKFWRFCTLRSTRRHKRQCNSNLQQ